VIEGRVGQGHDTRLGADFAKGSGRPIDAQLAAYPGSCRNWIDICGSGRLPPEWTPAKCLTLMASGMEAQWRVRQRLAANRRLLEEALRVGGLDGMLLLPDRRGGDRRDTSPAITCMVSSTSGLHAVVLPLALDGRGMPVGLEILGAAGGDEELIAMAGVLENRRGPQPAPRPSAQSELTMPAEPPLDLSGHNRLVPLLGWQAWRSRRGEALEDLEQARFRQLTRALLRRHGSPTGPVERQGGDGRRSRAKPPPAASP